MRTLRRIAMRWFWSEWPMPQWMAPYVLGFALGAKGRRIK